MDIKRTRHDFFGEVHDFCMSESPPSFSGVDRYLLVKLQSPDEPELFANGVTQEDEAD